MQIEKTWKVKDDLFTTVIDLKIEIVYKKFIVFTLGIILLNFLGKSLCLLVRTFL